jgi:uncharacterized membrane protein
MDPKPPRTIADVWKLLHMTNDKLEFMEQRYQTLREDVDKLETRFETKMDAMDKQVTQIRLTLAQWFGVALVIGVILQAITVAIIANTVKTTVHYERIPSQASKE